MKRPVRSARPTAATWLPVIARSLAFLCLEEADLLGKPLPRQVEFLDRLGLPRKDVARLLGVPTERLRP